MRTILVLLISFFFSGNVFSQTLKDSSSSKSEIIDTIETGTRKSPYRFAEVMPSFPGGESAFQHYLLQNIHSADSISPLLLIVEFVVDTNGTIAAVNVKKGSNSPELEMQVIHVIQSMPLWTPGKMNGRNVAVLMTLPLRICTR